MATAGSNYLLDTNVFLEAYNNYYSFDLCPGFWEFLLHHHTASGQILSIDKVRDEILYDEKIVEWANTAPAGFFASTGKAAIAHQYRAIMRWVNDNPQFTREAKAEFANEPDAWLVAYAIVNNCVVVTHETYDENVKSRVKIPNVCKQFGVNWVDTFTMLRQLDANFTWVR